MKLFKLSAVFVVLAVLSFFPEYPQARGGGGHSGGRSYHSSTSRSYRSSSKYGSVRVRSYRKKNGTVVQAHHRTKANNTKRDNWSTKGNINPYTGKVGTKDP